MKTSKMRAFPLLAGSAALLCSAAAANMEWQPIIIRTTAGELEVPVDSGEPATLPANPEAARLSERRERRAVRFAPATGAGLAARAMRISGEGGRYARTVVTVRNMSDAPVEVVEVDFMRGWAPRGARDGERSGNTDGSVAIFPSAGLFTGVEHPMCKLSVDGGTVSARLPVGQSLARGSQCTFSYVVGRWKGSSPRRDFQDYLERERAHPYRVLPHYNSWYDLNINRNDLPWQKRMNEQEAMGVMKTFRAEMGKRGVHIESYLWDDGWDEWNSLWDFHPGFPRGFDALAAEAHRDRGASIGCWMSPCGGYGRSRDARVNYSRGRGYIGKRDSLLKMSDPTYYAAFRDRVMDMIKRYDMNIFKFDRMGVGHDADGADAGCAPEINGVIRLVDEMRRAKKDVFVNCTVGTWASPFWVMYADSIWRGGNDFGKAGTGTDRQRWITYRDNKTYDRFVKPCPLFPLNSMMVHGIIVGKNGPPACMDISGSPASTRDFADEVWMDIASGTGLQEYYITPSLMHREWWDILADGVKWLKAREQTLRDVHWAGGDPVDGDGRFSVYGYASAGAGAGTLILRNPSGAPAEFSGTLADILDLPDENRGASVKSQKTVYSHDAALSKASKCSDEVRAKLAPFGVVLVEFDIPELSARRR